MVNPSNPNYIEHSLSLEPMQLPLNSTTKKHGDPIPGRSPRSHRNRWNKALAADGTRCSPERPAGDLQWWPERDIPGLVNIQKAIEHGYRHSEFSH